MYAPINDVGFRVHRNLRTRMQNQAPQNQPYQDPPPLFTQGGARSANRGTICTARRTTKSIAPAAVPYTPVGSSPKPPDQSREPVRPASTRSASLRLASLGAYKSSASYFSQWRNLHLQRGHHRVVSIYDPSKPKRGAQALRFLL